MDAQVKCSQLWYKVCDIIRTSHHMIKLGKNGFHSGRGVFVIMNEGGSGGVLHLVSILFRVAISDTTR